jgi:hypothetical protein
VTDVERAGELLQQRERVVDAHLRPAADVVDAARDARGARGREQRRDDVRDEREVARLLAVAEDRQGLAAQRRPAEAGERHVRPLPRAVDGEEAQRDRLDAEVPVVEAAEVLGGELRRAVGRERRRQDVLRRREALCVAVDRRRRRMNEPRTLWL